MNTDDFTLITPMDRIYLLWPLRNEWNVYLWE